MDWKPYLKVIGKCRFITTFQEAEDASVEILQLRPVYLGFDVEAIDFVAVIVTFATHDTVYLFRLCSINYNGYYPPSFLKILSSNAISKVSNASPMDAIFLSPYRFKLGGLIDLQQLSRAKEYPRGLKHAFNTIFTQYPPMIDIYSKEVDTWFNWNCTLREEYIIYAAYDARASYMLFQFYLGVC